ncbi:hypothetical protein D3C76_62250 [compost metagenome]
MSQYGGPGGFFDFIREVPLFVKVIAAVLLIFVVGSLLFVVIKGLYVWLSNNAAEVLQRSCRIIDKRIDMWGSGNHSNLSSNYYITFEFEDSSRIELYVTHSYYGIISVGDRGTLTYQGTRFKDFDRRVESSYTYEKIN